ncbi:HAD-IIB family hydrolase [Microcoleus sp. T2B6]|uniref:HAD-IIB family hydrolase n=1 Tax=Microcoleus sp. T2B6 TaxID=3055424 RepID=UPI002FD3F3FC
MTLLSLSQVCLSDIRLIASDIDGTLTQNGKFVPTLLETINKLGAAGVTVLLVTGNSAGWVSALVNYLPVTAVIAENGGLYLQEGHSEYLLSTITSSSKHRQQLEKVFRQLQEQFPNLRESTDNQFRITDWTFNIDNLSLEELQAILLQCHAMGWGFTYSAEQCHIQLSEQDKATGLMRVLERYFPDLSVQQVLTVGDSPNDEAMFASDKFPLSVGVANILRYKERMRHYPKYITKAQELEGFCELVEFLLNSKK